MSPLEAPAALLGPKLLDRVRAAIRLRHYRPRTEEAYVHWVRRFIVFHHKRHPIGMREAEVTAFLSHLAHERGVSASTQNQARSALDECRCRMRWRSSVHGYVLNRGPFSVRSPAARPAYPHARMCAIKRLGTHV